MPDTDWSDRTPDIWTSNRAATNPLECPTRQNKPPRQYLSPHSTQKPDSGQHRTLIQIPNFLENLGTGSDLSLREGASPPCPPWALDVSCPAKPNSRHLTPNNYGPLFVSTYSAYTYTQRAREHIVYYQTSSLLLVLKSIKAMVLKARFLALFASAGLAWGLNRHPATRA